MRKVAALSVFLILLCLLLSCGYQEDPVSAAAIPTTVIYSADGITVSIIGLTGTESFQYEVKNQSEKNVSVVFDRVAVNNCMVQDWLYYRQTAPGKMSIESYDISYIEQYGFDAVAWIDLHYQVMGGESSTVLAEGYSHVDTTIAEEFDQEFQVPCDSIYHGKLFSVENPDKEHRFFGSNEIYLAGSATDITNVVICNQSDSELSVSVKDLSVNGIMIDGAYFTDILPYCYSIIDIAILDSVLEDAGVSTADDVDFRLVACNASGQEESTEEVSIDLR